MKALESSEAGLSELSECGFRCMMLGLSGVSGADCHGLIGQVIAYRCVGVANEGGGWDEFWGPCGIVM